MKNKNIQKIFAYLFFAVCFFYFAKICSANSFIQMMPPTDYASLEEALIGIMNYLRGIAGLVALIFIIIGGIMYILSMGNIERMERAKKTITYAIAGFAIVIAAPSFLKEITSILGGKSLGISGPTLQEILTGVLRFLLSILGLLSIISTMIGAILILTAYGNEEKIEIGKKTVKYSVIGTTIALGSLLIVKQIVVLLTT